MSLWGGRFRLEDKSVTHRDFDEPGEGLRADYPPVPPGVFVGKFGRAAAETTVRADFQPKQRVPNPAYSLKQNFRMARPLIVLEDSDYPRAGYGWCGMEEEEDCCLDEYDPPAPSASPQWPPEPCPEWSLPPGRLPYLHSSTLRVTGQRERLTSTYTEDLGCVRPGEIADFDPPPPGLLVWGPPQRRTEYLDNFSSEQIRAPGYHGGLAPPRRARSPPCWESSYVAMCRETLEAPSWLRDFLATPPDATAPTRPRL